MLLLGRSQVEALLDVDSLIEVLSSAMADLSAGRASVPDRVAALVPEHEGFLAAMPGFLPSAGVLMTKLVSLFPHIDFLPLLKEGDSYGSRCRDFCFVADCPPGVFR